MAQETCGGCEATGYNLGTRPCPDCGAVVCDACAERHAKEHAEEGGGHG